MLDNCTTYCGIIQDSNTQIERDVPGEDVCITVVSATNVKMIIPLSKQENHEL